MSPRRPGLNAGDSKRALPFGASCAASCQHIARCRELYGLKGNEGECVHSPSQYLPNSALDRAPDEADALVASDFA